MKRHAHDDSMEIESALNGIQLTELERWRARQAAKKAHALIDLWIEAMRTVRPLASPGRKLPHKKSLRYIPPK